MKKILSMIMLLAISISVVACTTAPSGTDESGDPSSNQNNPFKDSYKNNISCTILKDNAENKLTLAEGFEFMDKSELAVAAEPAISTIVELLDDHAFRFTGGNSFDEYGILHVKEQSDVQTVQKAVSDYLKAKKEDALYRSYFPGEEHKLDEAEVKVYGNYVVYGMLDQNNRTELFAQIKNLLLEA
jgi:hypothetical protein